MVRIGTALFGARPLQRIHYEPSDQVDWRRQHGPGNIAKLLKSGRSPDDISSSDPNQDCRKALAEMGITSFANSSPVMAQTDLIVLAVKPQIMDNVLTNSRWIHLRQRKDHTRLQLGVTINTPSSTK